MSHTSGINPIISKPQEPRQRQMIPRRIKAALPRSEIRLENNEYRGILVAINENVAENVNLIENLKELFTNASREMYQATHNRAYMKEITILVPKTWSDAITNIAASSEIFDSANIIVDKPNAEWGDSPYTNQFAPCGKVLVHEWGHLRWGLFDEYATDDKSHFYLNEDRYVEPTRCSRHVSGIALNSDDFTIQCNPNPEKGVLPNKWCRFYPERDVNKQKATGSYMHMNFLDTVTEFCHSNASGDPFSLHNSMAPNQQNIKCSQRSAWDVMSQSPDFIDGNNPPRYVLDTTPDFIIVKTSPLRIVFVLDISGSMSFNNRIGILESLATKFIRYVVPGGHFVGIVEFDSHATVKSNLTEITSSTTREYLVSLIPSYTSGATCIGCGLLSGIQVLESNGQSARGGILLLISDGQENVSPYINTMKPDLISKGVVVDTVALSGNAEDMTYLSLDTRGIAYLDSENEQSTALNDAITATITTRFGGSQPDGNVIDDTSSDYTSDVDRKLVVFTITGLAMPGTWSYNITSNQSQTVEVAVQSEARDGVEPIHIFTKLSDVVITETPPKAAIYVQVNQGYSPILHANVIATVERPTPHASVQVQLLDNGAGTVLDSTKNDGVYSGLFLEFVTATCPNCRYNVKIKVEARDGLVSIPISTSNNGQALSIRPPGPKEESNITVPIDDFDRVDTGGAIQAPVTVSDDDEFPPSRITDLRVTETSYDDQTVKLEWTAPGNDLDKGAADGYDLRYSRNFTTFSHEFMTGEKLTNNHTIEGNLSSPSLFGKTETATIQLPATHENITYFFAIRAYDIANNTAAPSNIISTAIVVATLSDDDFTTESYAPTTEGNFVMSTEDDMDVIATTGTGSESLSTPVIVAASVGGALILALICIGVLVFAKFFYTRQKSIIAPKQPRELQMSYDNTGV
uniref:Epithelial chloride channel protein-like n=1 Tax=Saccoglossus kowalevskii TaxID=10224 RepID=A0ABM0LYV1_SACKO|nr:PREDICTED: epithelial chloride channel protein-like [Saccoglossus kowalevskii]